MLLAYAGPVMSIVYAPAPVRVAVKPDPEVTAPVAPVIDPRYKRSGLGSP